MFIWNNLSSFRIGQKTKSDLGSFLALLFEFSSSPNYNFVMENFEIVYLSSLLNEKAGDFIQDELKKYGYPELKMAHGDIFHVLFEAGELSAKEIAGRTRRSKSTVSELVDRLVKLGYVCKKPDPADARGVKVSEIFLKRVSHLRRFSEKFLKTFRRGSFQQ